ncbi:diguanylate cyclase domain-containing protein [Caballeronia sp. SBC1]|uniref:diguanylate cyclase domain-containing protein n=1 Tax=Caballeronia sp. SBC1 TaxID=2705548 RepID=UPI001408E179|nr:diguanylate cyclase [Caballeronia sp. SBC1]
MIGPDETKDDATIAAAIELADLRKQVGETRAELLRLRRAVATAKISLGTLHASDQLREANGKLVIATLQAQSDSDTATRTLGEVSRANEIDALTGLPNRAVLFKRLVRASAEMKAQNRQLAVLFIDLNGFKQVNDTRGHAVGDQVLKRAALCLIASTRATDFVSRYGGDEFLVLLNDISRSDAAIAASRIVEALTFPVRVGDDELWLTASVGISIYPDDAEEAESLVDCADTAMYRAKRIGQGNGGYAFHVEEPATIEESRARVELTLKRATEFDLAAIQPAHYLDLKEANEQLVIAAIGAQELRAAAEVALKRQNEFLAVVAHELRNPLSPILAAAQSLGRAGTNEPLAPRAQIIIERQVAHMSRLVNDLLDMSRVTTGRFNLERHIVELDQVVAAAIDTCGHVISARSQELTVYRPSCELKIDGDAARLTQVLINLLDNASKYTPQGGVIKLVVAVDKTDIVLTLSDTGIGITADALPHVFEPFLQDTHAIAFNNAGLGIGLTVVRELVVAHGGSVTAHSAGSGLGSCFIVTLPVAHQS